jgi:hypothetical protein
VKYKKDVRLIDDTELAALIEQLDLRDEKKKAYLKARWFRYVQWWNRRARESKWKYQTLRCIVMIGSALIPALVGLREMRMFEAHTTTFTIATIVVSLLIAISAGAEEIFRFGEIWRDKRIAAELIKGEGFRYFELTGPYKGMTHESAYVEFTAAVENLIEHEIKDYFVAVRPNDDLSNASANQLPVSSGGNQVS